MCAGSGSRASSSYKAMPDKKITSKRTVYLAQVDHGVSKAVVAPDLTLPDNSDAISAARTPSKSDVEEVPRPARWRKAGTEKDNAAVTQKQQLAEIKAYFEEV